MIRKILLVVILVFLITGAAFAFQNEPDGFRGLKWGDAPTEDMHFFGQNVDMWDLYRREGDKMEIWNVKLNDIIYKFYDKKKFMGMACSIGSKDDYDILEIFCREKFGEPTEETKSRLEWWGKKLG